MTAGATATIDYGPRGEVRVVADAAALARAAADAFAEVVSGAAAAGRAAFVALSGGSTPTQMGGLLAQAPYRDDVPWDRVQVFWGDERWVPEASPESNAGVAKRTFLDRVAIPPDRVHPFPTVDLSANEAVARYVALLGEIVPAERGVPRFDLIFLGMGDDGHTASLFPGTAAIRETRRPVVAHEVPKLNAIRLTLTPPVLNGGRRVVFLVSGAAKAERLADVLDGPERADELPAQIVRPTAGPPIWLVDRGAASALGRRPEPARG